MESSPGFSLLVFIVASLLNTFLFLVGGSGALRDVQIVLPRYTRRGDDVRMTCNYNLERDQMYAVNWYRVGERKKTQEFYRYVPKEAPPQKAFQLPGYFVDVRRSSDHDVYLRNVSLDLSGVYKCSVTAEQTFETLSSSNDMTVVVIGEDIPYVHMDRTQYHPGDKVTVECQSPFSFPPANITWFYNETEVGPSEHHVKTDYTKSNTDPVTQSTVSKYSFDLPIPDKFPAAGNSAVTIKCRVTLFTLYDQNSSIQSIAPTPRRLTGTDTLLRQGASSSSTLSSSLSSTLHYLLCFLLFLLITSYMTTPTTTTTAKKATATTTTAILTLPPEMSLLLLPKSSLLSSSSSCSPSPSFRTVASTTKVTPPPPAAAAYLSQLFPVLLSLVYSFSCPVYISLNWLLCPVLRSLRYPFYYLCCGNDDHDHRRLGHHYHHLPHPSSSCCISLSPVYKSAVAAAKPK